jgi:hypothetical protein
MSSRIVRMSLGEKYSGGTPEETADYLPEDQTKCKYSLAARRNEVSNVLSSLLADSQLKQKHILDTQVQGYRQCHRGGHAGPLTVGRWLTSAHRLLQL